MTKVLLPLLWVSGLGCYNVSYHLKFLWFFSCQLNFSLFNFSLVSLNFADLGYVHQFWPILRYLSRSSKFTFSSRNFVNFLIRHFPSWNIRGDVLNTSIWKQTVDDTPVKVVIVWRTDTYYKCPASPCNNTQISWFLTGSKCSIMFSHINLLAITNIILWLVTVVRTLAQVFVTAFSRSTKRSWVFQ